MVPEVPGASGIIRDDVIRHDGQRRRRKEGDKSQRNELFADLGSTIKQRGEDFDVHDVVKGNDL